MNAEIVHREEFWVLGPLTRIQPASADYKVLWEQGFMPHYAGIKARAVDAGYCSVYFPSGVEGWVDHLAGMMVRADCDQPDGLVLRQVPAGMYAKFICTMGTIGPTWREIYDGWLPASDYREDEVRPAVEYYPPETSGPESPVMIFVAVAPK